MKLVDKVSSYNMVVLLICLLCNVAMAQSLRIYIDDEKDLLVFTGKVAPVNIAGATNNMLLNAIGEHPIEFVPSSYKRALRIMSQQPHPTCLFNKVKTPEREANFLFSRPINLYLSRRLYIHSHADPLDEALLDKFGHVKSLSLLFETYKKKLIVIAGTFSYGPFLDKQLAQVSSENKVIREGSNHYDTVYRMFNLRRVDFLLAYPAEIYRHVKIDKAEYQSYRMANSPEYILGHMMCNDTKVSRAFIAKVNDIMVKLYKQEQFIDAHLLYLPEEEHDITRQYIDTLKNNSE
ncbi:hypothetical protein PCIT_b0773 [Pseudoalteromonas citrea]|uniref:Solute-binding protein family 3/N-terminal domain-containing protein n=2 Tax=Pseudoalteromonas citrea TaxID=43655 RepID=A0AAD4AEX9_9GAMM|nr:hypothetical protein [Pseudoalteromonas citrea]KAF7764721.1 hypothetical protein PCIT_b0773 [Pseudoalteromonas citrea]